MTDMMVRGEISEKGDMDMKKAWKKIVVALFVFAMAFTGMSEVYAADGEEVAAPKYYVKEYSGETVKGFKDAGSVPFLTPAEDSTHAGWIFAGWFTKDDCETALGKEVDTDKTYWAKYVPAEVFSVKAQVKNGTTDKSVKTDLRLVSTVDSLDYKSVGFEVYYKGATTPIKIKTTTVFKRIEAAADGVEYGFSPNIFDSQSEYFVTATLTNIANKNFGESFYIRPYVETLDGTISYGVSRYARVEDSYLNIINVPVRVNAANTTGTMNVAYVADDFKYNDTYTSTLLEEKTIETPGYANGNVFENITITDDETNGVITITGDALEGAFQGEVAHLRFQIKDVGNLHKKNVFTVTEGENLSIKCVYNHFGISQGYSGTPDESWFNSAEEEFVITTAEELYGLASLVNAGTFGNKKVYLGSNITVNDNVLDSSGNLVSDTSGLTVWTPIGKLGAWTETTDEFKGSFDGQGHTISGLYFNNTATGNYVGWYSGLFGSVCTTGEISNVKVEDSYFEAVNYAGSIVGLLKKGTIKNCYSKATVACGSTAAGGIVGGVGASVTTGERVIKECWFDGSVFASTNSGWICGGIVGFVRAIGCDIEDCLNTGSISGKSELGGIIGRNIATTSITRTVSVCKSIGTTTAGIVIGNQNSGTLTLEDVHALVPDGMKAVGSGTVESGITTFTDKATYTGYNALDKMKNFEFENTWVVRQSDTPVLNSWCESGALYLAKTDWEGKGTEKEPYIIETPEQLYGLAQSVNNGTYYEGEFFKLGNDIKINTGNAANWGETAPKYNWIPMGTSTAAGFKGHFNTTGPVREIKGLYVNMPTTNHVGLFGSVIGGSIKNLKITNSYVKGQSFVAAFTGYTKENATIENVYTNATVVGTGSAIGSVVGYQVKGAVRNAWFDGAVTGVNSKQYVAGVVGRTVDGNGAVIENCLATGTVASGITSGNAYAGGILGGTANNVTVSNCFVALKSPLTTAGATGCVGSIAGGCSANTLTVKNCYAASGVYAKTHGTEGAGKESVTATVLTKYTGGNAYLNTTLDFDRHEEDLPQEYHKDGIWVAREGKAPGLKSFVAVEDRMELVKQNMYRADKSWYNTTDTVFTINNAEELVGFMQLVNDGTSFATKTVQLGADITLNVGKSSDWYAGKGETNLYNWIPIGNGDTIKFSGTFDGKGHTISGVYADHKANGIGLFGRVAAGSEVRDFKLTNSYFAGNSGVGSVVGWYAHGTYDTIYSDAIVHGLASSGGHYGGMLGLLGVDSTIKNCWFAGTLKANYGYTGGIVGSVLGQANTTIESCLNTGKITGTYDIGGIVGRVTAACTIKDSFSKATLKSTTDSGWLGHIAGRVIGVEITCDGVYALGNNLTMFKPDGDGTLAGTYASVADLTGANGFLNTWLNFDRPELPTPATGKWVAIDGGTPVLESFVEYADGERLALTGQNMYRVDTRWYDESKNEFTITTAEQLIGFASLVDSAKLFEGKIVYLGADIVVNKGDAEKWANGTEVESLYQWNPIGDYLGNNTHTESFIGKFDGQGYSIGGLYTVRTVSNSAAGLFEKIYTNAEVKNVSILNSYFQAKDYAGAVAGAHRGGNIENIYTDAIIKTTASSGGGIVGAAYTGTIKKCQFDGVMKSDGQFTGGITGIVNGISSIEDCLVTGSVITAYGSNNQYMGGIAGIIQANTTIENCLCDLKELNPNKAYCAGSVAGFVNPGLTITSSNVLVMDGIYDKVLGIQTSATSKDFSTSPIVVSDLNNYKGYMNTNLDFDNTWVAMEETAPRLQIFAPKEGRFDTTSWFTKAKADADGNEPGTEANPYIINSLAELYGFTKRVKDGNEFIDQYIKLTKSIVANTVEDENTVAGWATEVPYYVWSPIGGNPNAFKGHFDGGMNTISGLYATGSYGTKNPTWYTGLFGYIDGATVKNVKVEDSYFEAAYYTAGVVGCVNAGTVDSVYSNATTVATTGNAATIAGVIYNGTIQNSWADGNATAPKYAGGITSFVSTGTVTIQHCLNTGEVNATTEQAGGIVGRAASPLVTIHDCLNVGTVTSPKNHGTVLGYMPASGYTTTITQSYGYSDSTVQNSATKAVGNVATGSTATGGTKITDLALVYDAEAYERLNAGFWAARVENYPIPSVFVTDADYAKAATKDAFYAGDTTFATDESGAYLISSAAELYGLASLSQNDSFEGKTFKLTNNITINHQTLDENTTEATSYEWLPIGSESIPFKGTFDGQGNTISGLYKNINLTYDNKRWTGLFDTTEGCVVENLNIENTYFTYIYDGNEKHKDATRIGTISGKGGGTFRNISISRTVSLFNEGRGTGGIIGQTITDTTIGNSWFDGKAVCKTTFQSSYLGGLIGFASIGGNVVIEHSHVSGDVLGGSYHVGGLVGNIQGAVQATITDSMFNGNLKASDDKTGDVFRHAQLVGTVVANEASDTAGKGPSLTVTNCYGVNDFASYDIGAAYVDKSESYEPSVSGSGNVSVKADRLIGYAGDTASLDYNTYWVLTKSGTPMLKQFVATENIYDGSQLTDIFKLDTVGKTLADAEEVGGGRYTIKLTGKTKDDYTAYCNALDTGVFDAYGNDQSSDLNAEGVYNMIYTSAACGDTANDDWVVNVTFLQKSGVLTITVSSVDKLSQHLNADSIEAYSTTDGYTTSGLTPTFHMIEQKTQKPAASYVIQLSNGHFIVIDGGFKAEAPYLMEYLELLVPEGTKPIVEAWIISHAHQDHIETLELFVTQASTYQGKIYLEGIYYSEASDKVMSTVNSGKEDGHHHYSAYINRIGSVFQTTTGNVPQVYRMYTGQRYTFDTVVMDVMLATEQFAWSDYEDAGNVTNPNVFNETSTWTMFTINGKKLLTAGDSNYIGKEFVVNNYSTTYLTVDIFTALHHGENINREQSNILGSTANDDFSNAITVKGAVLYSYPIHWDDEQTKTTITARVNSFMKLQRQKGMSGIATTYESGSTGSKNPEDYFYHGQGTVVLTFGDDNITANVKAHNDWVNDYAPATTE